MLYGDAGHIDAGNVDALLGDMRLLVAEPTAPAAAIVAAHVGMRLARLYTSYVREPLEFAHRYPALARSIGTMNARTWRWTAALLAPAGVDHVDVLACMQLARRVFVRRKTYAGVVGLSYAAVRDDIEATYYETATNAMSLDADELTSTALAAVTVVETALATSSEVTEPGIVESLRADVRIVDELLAQLPGAGIASEADARVYRTALGDALAALDDGDAATARREIAAVVDWLRDDLGATDGTACEDESPPTANAKRRRRRSKEAPRKRRRARASPRDARAP